MNTSMAKGTFVRDHVLKMIDHLNELKILGVEINRESQTDIKLQSAEGLVMKPVSALWLKWVQFLNRKVRTKERFRNKL